MKKYINPKKSAWPQLLQRPTRALNDLETTISEIFSEVQRKGDIAVATYTQKFDGVTINNSQVSEEEINAATISEALKKAILLAKDNIETFHKAQKTATVRVETMPGVVCWQEKRPIKKVGLYIPGGTAPLFSTILMLAIPAKLAGCTEIVLCTPPSKDGTIHPAILFTAALCGITKLYKVGGVQAISAMTFGTETIPAVYKIFGPGNQFVTAAKQRATNYGVAIDMPAGPSELLVFADETAIPAFVASDLLSQAEHGIDSQVMLVSTSEIVLNNIMIEVETQLDKLPRKEIAKQALLGSKSIVVSSEEEAIELINQYAPEHCTIIAKKEAFFVQNIQNAGSVFIGNYTPESAGDYASGTNHTLPTNGYSKQYSGVNLDSFLKSVTFQKISEKGIEALGPFIEIMADAEGLQAHKNAVSLRLASIRNNAPTRETLNNR
ncbi:histidinol dehydrogenase [Rasiella rasia]|uniref:Histidinol dehydrogenase n=1 Tax=Rasiella rasia TaxID=2744027 RepID=A0A6G6GIP6_9FLAO|nr:histidinol dehydrogenase [Rasiella rasia]QIE58466.1 histidinol dehydrogenase [Rasiella rasia]